jgi:hypothetical protein
MPSPALAARSALAKSFCSSHRALIAQPIGVKFRSDRKVRHEYKVRLPAALKPLLAR